MNYYIYSFADPRNGRVRYIGKGRGRRYDWWKYARSESKEGPTPWLRKLHALRLQPIVRIIVSGLSQEEAFAREAKEIAAYGRMANGTGPLLNLSAGGKSGGAGCIISASIRRKQSESHLKVCDDPKVRARMSQGAKRRYAKVGEREKASEIQRRRFADPIQRAKIAAGIQKALTNPEVRARRAKAAQKRCARPAIRLQMIDAAWHRAPKDGKPKGIHLDKIRDQWEASIWTVKSIHLGYYANEDEAAYAYNIAVLNLRGKGYLNPIPKSLSQSSRKRIKNSVLKRLELIKP